MIRLVRVKRYGNASVVGVLEVVIYQYVVFHGTKYKFHGNLKTA